MEGYVGQNIRGSERIQNIFGGLTLKHPKKNVLNHLTYYNYYLNEGNDKLEDINGNPGGPLWAESV